MMVKHYLQKYLLPPHLQPTAPRLMTHDDVRLILAGAFNDLAAPTELRYVSHLLDFHKALDRSVPRVLATKAKTYAQNKAFLDEVIDRIKRKQLK